MTCDPERHHRRSVRRDGYDYVEAGAYFVTICTQDHLCVFGRVVDSQMQTNGAGSMVQTAWDELPTHYPGVSIDAFIVMPNHIHGIIMLAPAVGAGPRACPDSGLCRCPKGPGRPQGGRPQGVAPTTGSTPGMSLGSVVGRFKTLTTKRYTDGIRCSGWRTFSGRLWQRNYYEHIIRNERALNHIRRYIIENPLRWAQDRENPDATEPEGPDAWRIPPEVL